MAVTVTLAGVALTGAQQPLPVPVPLGSGPSIEFFQTWDSASQGGRRIPHVRRYHESWDDIEINCTVTSDADFSTLETSYRARHQTVSYAYGGTTWTCVWAEGGLQAQRLNFSETHYQLKIKLHVLSSA